MNRRRFAITAFAAGTAGAIVACSRSSIGRLIPPEGSNLQDLVASYGATETAVLNVQYAVTNIAGYRLRTRTYNGKTIGPTIEIRPGGTLSMRVNNMLPKNPPALPPNGVAMVPNVNSVMDAMNATYRGPLVPSTTIDPDNNPHGFNTTNLHVHGIQTLPHLFAPLGTSDPAAMMLEINPGHSFVYNFPVPANHPSGLHWYHPHKHGSTDVQVSGGMAGLIIVRGPIDEVPEIKAAREFLVVVQTLDVNPSVTTPGIYEREYIAYKTPAAGGYSFGTQYTMLTVNGEGAYWIDNTNNTYKPLALPQFSVAPGEVIRLRILNGTNYFPLMLALPGFEAWQIGFDGVNLLEAKPKKMGGQGVDLITPENIFSAPVRVAMSGNRIELLLRAPKTPGSYRLASVASQGIDFSPRPKIQLAEFLVGGAPVSMSVPYELPKPVREYPIIQDGDLAGPPRKFVFNQGKRTDLLTGFGFTINGHLYRMDECEHTPKVGTCEEWRIENASEEAHPFHLHTNSFQLTKINEDPVSPPEIWDTFIIPPKQNGVNGSITFRVRFLEWHGKDVFHCHILPHEDTGMMQNFLMI